MILSRPRKTMPLSLFKVKLPSFFLLLGLSALVGLSKADPAIEIIPGSGTFTYTDDVLSDVNMRIFYQAPETIAPTTPIWFVIHGQGRNAEGYFKNWRREAEQRKILLLVPEFTNERFPNAEGFNLANIEKGKRSEKDQERWTYAIIERLFDQARTDLELKTEHYLIFGHSAGSQFSHRMLLLMEHTRAAGAVFANAGWYTMPNRKIEFPYGVGGMKLTDQNLANFVQRPVLVLLGADDTDENHSQLRTTKQAMAQGPHRLARGESFYTAAKQEAERLRVPFNWELITVPGVAHSNKGLVSTAAEYLQRIEDELKKSK